MGVMEPIFSPFFNAWDSIPMLGKGDQVWENARYDNAPKYTAAVALESKLIHLPYSLSSVIAVLCLHQNKNPVKQTSFHPLEQSQCLYLGKFRRLNQNRKSWKV